MFTEAHVKSEVYFSRSGIQVQRYYCDSKNNLTSYIPLRFPLKYTIVCFPPQGNWRFSEVYLYWALPSWLKGEGGLLHKGLVKVWTLLLAKFSWGRQTLIPLPLEYDYVCRGLDGTS